MARRKYSDKYKQEAVVLTRAPGATIRAVAADLGIDAHKLGKSRRVSQIALASLASFLLLFATGFTNCGAISRTV